MDPLLARVRETDRRTFLALLTAPDAKRPALAALAAYGLELARIPLAVSEPMAGEIRLTWWSEVARGMRDDEARRDPLAAALLDAAAAFALDRGALASMAEARVFDLYNDPMPDLEAFEDYAGRIASVPIQMAAQVLDPSGAGASGQAAGHAGVYAVAVERLATLARDRASGRCFAPPDLLMRAWLSPGDLARPDLATADPGLADCLVGEWLLFAERYRTLALADCAALPRTLAPAFAGPLASVATQRAIEAAGRDILDRIVRPSPLAEQWALMRATSRFGGGLLGRLRQRVVGSPG